MASSFDSAVLAALGPAAERRVYDDLLERGFHFGGKFRHEGLFLTARMVSGEPASSGRCSCCRGGEGAAEAWLVEVRLGEDLKTAQKLPGFRRKHDAVVTHVAVYNPGDGSVTYFTRHGHPVEPRGEPGPMEPDICWVPPAWAPKVVHEQKGLRIIYTMAGWPAQAVA